MRKLLTVLLAGGALMAAEARAVSSEEATKLVTAAYEDVLGRKPDADGLRTYRSRMVENGWSEKEVRNDLRRSAEFKTGGDVEGAIKRAYQDVLGRNPDKEGLAFYRKKMTDDKWSEQKVREALRKSDEARKKKK